MGDWRVGQWMVPAGTVLQTNVAANDERFRWNGMALPALPMNARALDQESADALVGLWLASRGLGLAHRRLR